MSNPDPHPTETVCENDSSHPELLAPREVPLGGPRAMTVRRTLPQRALSLIGAWCFLDHYGPDEVTPTSGMKVPRHPHTGLATVSWLFDGAIDHLDSTGGEARIEPGDLALMTAGRGITHQEFSTDDTRLLRGVQLWYALPDAERHGEPDLQTYRAPEVGLDGGTARVFIGSLAGSTSPVRTRTAGLVAAEIVLDAGSEVVLELDPAFEYGVLADSGTPVVCDESMPVDHLRYHAPGHTHLVLGGGPDGARVVLVGGVPLGEQIVMWWNFVGRSHDEVAAYRARYQREIGAEGAGADGTGSDVVGDGTAPGTDPASTPVDGVDDEVELFGPWPDGTPDPIPAPVLPNVRLRPRG